MRGYLFHGKRVDNGEWVEGYYCKVEKLDKSGYEHFIIKESADGGSHLVHPESVGQWTGMCDKNGKKIFEGDIVNCITSDFDGSDKYVYNLRIIDITDFEQMGFLNFCNEIEIIGNIHNNADLLEG